MHAFDLQLFWKDINSIIINILCKCSSLQKLPLIAEPNFCSATSSVSFEQSSFAKIVFKVFFSDSDTLPSMVAVVASRASVVSSN